MICVKCGKEAPDAPFCAFCGWKQASPIKAKTRRGNGEGRVWKRGNTWYAQVTLYTQASVINGKKVYKQKRRTKGGFATKRDALDYIATLRSTEGRRMPTVLELSYYTARDIKTLLSHIYKKALPDQYVTDNLSQYIVLPDLEEKEAEPFTEEEVQAFWKAYASGDVFVGYMLVMIYTGMMPGELFACSKTMIDYEKREIWGCGKKTKKRKKEVPIVFPDFIAPVLEVLCAFSDSDMLQPMGANQWYEEYHAATKRVGVRDLPPYSCRHTTGTEAAKLNLNAAIIQNVMRHSKITTTQKYIHLGAESAHAAVNQIPALNS